MNCRAPPPDQLPPLCLPNLNWDDPLSSIVPSPPAPLVEAAISGEISSFICDPNSLHVNSLMPFPSDPEFTERAARYSWFSGGNYGPCAAQFGITEVGKLSRVSSSQCLKAMKSPAQSWTLSEMGDGEFGSCREDSSVTDPASVPGESNVKKRKAAPKKRGKFAEENDLYAKKCRLPETAGNDKDHQVNCDRKNDKDNSSKAIEPPQDYIHVRARRGQATDSHSLAERVRREKISQRMKLLQDLVPGCNKITGKALMLDEIINYVQSLQWQVEFLSMKLATVNPRLDVNTDNLIIKEARTAITILEFQLCLKHGFCLQFLMNQANTCLPNSFLPLDNLPAQFPFGHQSKEGNALPFTEANGMESHCSMSQIDIAHHQPGSLQSSLVMFGGAASQVGNLWDDELHGVLRTGFGLNQKNGVNSQSFHGNHRME